MVTPQLYSVVYDDLEEVRERKLLGEFSTIKVAAPPFSVSLGPLAANVISKIEAYLAAPRAEFTCDLDALMSGSCKANRIVIYSMNTGGGKEARSRAGTSLVPLDKWDITKRYGVLPLLDGYDCELAKFLYDGEWKLEPPKLRCTGARPGDTWIVKVVVKGLGEGQGGLVAQMTKALYDELDRAGDGRLVSYRLEEERHRNEIATVPIMTQMSTAIRPAKYVLELIVQ